jgi:Putative peptidoglycan binding domain.
MVLTAQRFVGDQTLEDCLAGNHRMTIGDTNTDSVLKVQVALSDLGYRPMLIDGKFGDITAAGVKAFKTDQGLAPPDPVVGTGTMGALDALFGTETSTPDDPDATTNGLAQLVADVTTNIVLKWFDAAIAALQQFPTDQTFPANPDWVAFDAAMERNFHTSLFPQGRANLIRLRIRPTYEAARKALTDPFVTIVTLDRAAWDSDFHGPYRPSTFVAGAQILVTPPFRNVLQDNDRGLVVAKGALFPAFVDLDVLGLPMMARYQNYGTLAIRNVVAYAAFGFELHTGNQAFFQPLPVWA